jgi:hypothetical protein
MWNKIIRYMTKKKLQTNNQKKSPKLMLHASCLPSLQRVLRDRTNLASGSGCIAHP